MIIQYLIWNGIIYPLTAEFSTLCFTASYISPIFLSSTYTYYLISLVNLSKLWIFFNAVIQMYGL